MSQSKPEQAQIKVIQSDFSRPDFLHWVLEFQFRTVSTDDMLRIVEKANSAINAELLRSWRSVQT